jgi:hypothetical protein
MPPSLLEAFAYLVSSGVGQDEKHRGNEDEQPLILNPFTHGDVVDEVTTPPTGFLRLSMVNARNVPLHNRPSHLRALDVPCRPFRHADPYGPFRPLVPFHDPVHALPQSSARTG